MTEESMMFVYNRGKRTWDIPTAWDEDRPKDFVQISPGQSKELPKDVAEKYVSRYKRDLMFGQGTGTKESPVVQKLRVENEELKERIAELEKEKLSEKDQLILEAEKLGLTVDKRSGVDTLKAIIEKAKTDD